MKRYYLKLNDGIRERLDYPEWLTMESESLTSKHSLLKAAGYSDLIVECDGNICRYIKDRIYAAYHMEVPRDDMVLIRLSSHEMS